MVVAGIIDLAASVPDAHLAAVFRSGQDRCVHAFWDHELDSLYLPRHFAVNRAAMT